MREAILVGDPLLVDVWIVPGQASHDDTASITLDGWEIQRRCPHLKADLSKFGVVDGNKLTCNLHGWEWNLETGRCLTTKGHELRSERK